MPQASVSTSGSGDKTILDVATADKNSFIDALLFVSGAATVILKDESTITYGTYTLGAAGFIPIPPGSAQRFTFTGDLLINVSTNVTVTGHLWYASR